MLYVTGMLNYRIVLHYDSFCSDCTLCCVLVVSIAPVTCNSTKICALLAEDALNTVHNELLHGRKEMILCTLVRHTNWTSFNFCQVFKMQKNTKSMSKGHSAHSWMPSICSTAYFFVTLHSFGLEINTCCSMSAYYIRLDKSVPIWHPAFEQTSY